MWKIFKYLFNQSGQTPGTSNTNFISPELLNYFLGISKPSTGLLGEGAFSALGADPTQFMQMSGLPAMQGAQDLFRINPAEAEQLGTAESKARENILQNTPMRGGELNQGLAQNAMHFGGLRSRLIEDRRNQALNALQGLSGFRIPPSGTSTARGATGPSQGSQLLSSLGQLGVSALSPLLTSGINQLTGLLGLGSTDPFAGQTANLAGTGFENLNLLSPVDMFPTDLSFSMPDAFSSFLGGFF